MSLTPHPRPLSPRRGEGGLRAIFARMERTSTPLGCRPTAGSVVGAWGRRGESARVICHESLAADGGEILGHASGDGGGVGAEGDEAEAEGFVLFHQLGA